MESIFCRERGEVTKDLIPVCHCYWNLPNAPVRRSELMVRVSHQ